VGDRGANLRTAIALYERSLAIPALRHRRDLAAVTYGNLGQAWQALPPAPDGATLWRALAAYREALRYWTPERNPAQNRRMHELAGQALFRMPAGDRRENLLRSLTHFDQALAARPRDDDPIGWAQVQVERGTVLAALPAPGRRRSLEAARDALAAALTVITPDLLPNVHDKVVQNLERVNARLARMEAEEPLPPGPADGP
jgi:tetratricopeptide (TPR) repeat protein